MISIGKAIYSILIADTGVTSLVNSRIYPIVAPKDTPFPLVVYDRRSNPEDTKDNNNVYFTNVEFSILDSEYGSTIDIALAIQSALEHYRGTIEGINIKDINLISVDEQYGDDAFIQKLIFMVISI